MKKLLNVWAILAITSITALMTGCGGGGGDDDDDGGGGAGTAGLAPASLNGKSVIIIDDSASVAPMDVQFAISGDTFTAFVPATSQTLLTGTYQYTPTGPDAATLVLTGSNGFVMTVNLNFTSDTSGNFSFTTNTGASGTGTFSGLTTTPPGGEEPPPGGEQPPPGGEEPPPGGEQPPPGGEEPPPGGEQPPPGNGGAAPAALTGRTVSFNVSSGVLQGLMTVNFSTANTFSSPTTEGSGNYTYTLTGNSASLVLDYTAPPEFVGDRDTFALTYTAGSSGTFTGTTRIDNAESPIDGTFQVQ